MPEDIEWLKSKCVGTWLHDFKIYKSTDKCVSEVCSRCGQEEYFTIVNGKPDNLNYLDYHLKNALPTYHPYFYAEYPKTR